MCGCGRTLNDCTCAPDYLPPVTYFPYPGTPPRVPYVPPSHCGCNGGNGDSTGGLGSIPTAPRRCSPFIPPFPPHHSGVDACTDGRGRLIGFFAHRPSVVDPF